jgi:hypothetical protein
MTLVILVSAAACASTGTEPGAFELETEVLDTSFSVLGTEGVPIEARPPFEPLHMFRAPVDNIQISSTFGPRWKFSERRNDFHLGIDYYGERGTPLFAIGAGRVFATHHEGSEEFPNGGNVVVIEHAIPARQFHGQTVTRFFAVYLHVETIEVARGDQVHAGDVVATMGDSGTTEFVHLHFETRVQTMCSLPYQTEHPTLGCSTGFDPHVHPFLFVGGDNSNTFAVEEVPTESGFAVRYVGTRGDLDLDVIRTDLGTIGFGARDGIDATSVERLDDFDYGYMLLSPEEFVSNSRTIEFRIQFARRPSFIEIRDVYGRGLRFGRTF